jgi:hypothetical protein
MKLLVVFLVWTLGRLWNVAEAFTETKRVISYKTRASYGPTHTIMVRMPFLRATQDEQLDRTPEQEKEERSKLDAFLEKKYKAFYKLLNDEMSKAIKKGSVTIFVPNDAAFEALGEKKRKQLEDPRNEEIKEKMGSYHIMLEPISAIELRTEDWTKGRPKDGSKPSKYLQKSPILPSRSLLLSHNIDFDLLLSPRHYHCWYQNIEWRSTCWTQQVGRISWLGSL